MQKLRLRIVLGLSVVVIVILFIIETISVCSWDLCGYNQQSAVINQKNEISIVATIYPLAWMASDIDPAATVTTIVQSGIEPHDFSPTINDVKLMEDADLLIINRIVDEWAADVITDRKGPTESVMETLEFPSFEDSHVWLDPILMQEIVKNIGLKLERINPTNSEIIRENVLKKIAILQEIDSAYRSGLASCQIPEIISSHDAFGFLSRRYGFTVYGVAGFSPEDEPSLARLVELTNLIRSNNITTVFFEELASPEISRTLAAETGAKSDILDAIESLSSEESERFGYPVIMKKNLVKLEAAMICQ